MASKLFLLGTGVLLLGAAISLVATNPTRADYEAFAVEQARGYLKLELCPEELPLVGNSLEDECLRFLDSDAATPQLQRIIANGTERQNFFLFSLYTTQLAAEDVIPVIPAGLLPAYEVKSVGLWRSLHIYGADKL